MPHSCNSRERVSLLFLPRFLCMRNFSCREVVSCHARWSAEKKSNKFPSSLQPLAVMILAILVCHKVRHDDAGLVLESICTICSLCKETYEKLIFAILCAVTSRGSCFRDLSHIYFGLKGKPLYPQPCKTKARTLSRQKRSYCNVASLIWAMIGSISRNICMIQKNIYTLTYITKYICNVLFISRAKMEPLIYELLFYGSRVVLFFVVLHRRRALRRGRVIHFCLLTVLLTTFVRVRWIEPQQVALRRIDLDLGVGKKAALIADLHLWVYKDWTYLQRVVNTINKQPWVDMVFIAGDMTFRPSIHIEDMKELFQPLADLRVPVYMVLGNHDVEKPWPKLRNELVKTLEQLGVTFLANDVVDFWSWRLVGLGDHDGGEDDVFLLNQFHVADTVIVLTHNPDTTLSYANYNVDATLVWHTHCAQVRIPWIHTWIAPHIIPTRGNFDCGLMTTKYTTLLITPGLGEVHLPVRRFNPPTIDIVSF